MTWLNFEFNHLSGPIPPTIGSGLANLEVLDLDSNQFIGKIPKSISNASKLIHLNLGLNKFSGVIPIVLGNLTNLIEIKLYGNDLNGLIPTTINKLQGLQFLDPSNNRLKGCVIDELFQIRSLSELHLAYNMFSGLLPQCLENLTFLQKLDLSSNKLVSHIPHSIWSLKDIVVVDLSSNALNGTIPLEISSLRALTLLNLSNNQISGNNPPIVGSLQTLQNLSLENNRLNWTIPESLGSMISIEFLDLSQNYLYGVIPKSLESLVHLKYINLSYNLLHGEIPSGGPFTNFTAGSFVMNEDLCGKPQLQMLARVSYYELLQGTNGFDECNFLGQGSFGSVYKGILSSGQIVVVKIFKLDLEEALRSFDTECTAICNLRHCNLVKIINSCSNVDFKSLIMEFMPNGSLERWLYSHNYCLDILQRLNIMIDIASALEYLHHGSSTPIVHCDVKPSNVLLDEDMVAHLSDFGISKLLGEEKLQIYTKTFATVGYMAPEYGLKGVVSMKGDVYNYGVMLMEVFIKKKPTNDMFVEGLSLKDWVSKSTPHSIVNVLDTNLLQRDHRIGNILLNISSIFELALNCCIDLPEKRMNMADVMMSLEKIKAMIM
ncbi:receptor kinase-like protein Xa21 [Senna tora]|uniref:non-specific serine/threonine protein kinase n=1 Tax=Senna tora TaxID=362788 RepID=A0A834XC27_9FABA|nr:receptor kinase-like protein Xa21 [Senna tora]